jgi:nitrate/nitrite transporter NarK
MTYGSDAEAIVRARDQQNTAAVVGGRLLEELPEERRQAVTEIADKLAQLMQADRQRRLAKRPASKANSQAPLPALNLGLAVEGVSDEAALLVVADLNLLLNKTDWYVEQDFQEIKLPQEAKKLLEKDAASLDQVQLQRRNRLLLEAAYPQSLRKVYGAGWRKMMFVYGLLGIAVAAIFWITIRNSPAEHAMCNLAEQDLIAHGRTQQIDESKRATGGVPIKELVSSLSMWLNCASQFLTNAGWIFLVTWLPRYLKEQHDVPIESRAWMTFLPMGVGWTGMVVGGWLTDRLVTVVGLRWARALPLSISRFIAMGAYVVCLFEPTPWVAVGAFIVVSIATNLGTPAIWAYVQDVGGRKVGSVLGWGNMWGNLGATVFPTFLIWIAVSDEGRNWNAVFWTCIIAFFLSGVASIGIDATKPVVKEEIEQ